ncbi:MAG: choice-of-anchor D domain-containing protein [Bryobacteraceae bacterium]
MSSPVAETGTALWRGMRVHYVMRNGLPIYQNDIILDNPVFGPDLTRRPARDAASGDTFDAVSRVTPQTLGEIYPVSLWPAVGVIYQIPYIITNGSANLTAAIAQYNKTFGGLIQWVPRTTQTDYANLYQDPSNQCGCGESYIGRIGGEQTINCAINCSVGTLAHEMGHATGLWHEQSRPDRGTYVTLDYSHIRADSIGDDAIATNDAWIYGPYDYASIMEYFTFNLTADGSETIQSIPAGMPLSNSNFYTTADIDTIRRLYSAAPTYVTVDTNPTGLQVIVDGTTITTPRTYTNWALNSQHTLALPAGISSSGLQSLGGLDYQFGAWNDGGAASHTITITPGNGLPGYPPTSPAQTVYTANFIQWVPFSPNPSGAYPSGAGTLTTTPTPTTFAGVGQFFMANQNVAFNANANSGYNFIQWYGYYYCDWSCYLSFNANPLNLHYWTTQNPEPGFTTSQVTTITTNPPGLLVQVDGATYASPASFSPDPYINGSAWAAGTTHTVSATSPQNPWSPNTSYVWSGWSDGQAQSHQITVASGNSTITADYNTQVGLVLATNSNSNCAGTVAANPPGPSNAGTSVTFTATPSAGFVFAQWEGALSGSTNPSIGPVNQEEFVQADFNTISTPLAITSLSPASVGAGAAPFTLTINGTGFTAPPADDGNTGGYAYVWYNDYYYYRTLTYVSPTELQIPILAADVANPGAIQIIVENIVNGSCWVFESAQLPVSPAQMTLSPTSLDFGVNVVGVKSGSKAATLHNSGSTALTIGSITTAAGDFASTNTCPTGSSTLAAGGSCTINVTFTPTASGPRKSVITISDNASLTPQEIILTGTGTTASLSASSLTFGSQSVGTSSSPKTVTLTNKGSAVLSLYQIRINGTNAGDFLLNNGCGSTLGAGNSCNLQVTFKPTATGSRTASLQLSDGGGGSPQQVGLSGTGM